LEEEINSGSYEFRDPVVPLLSVSDPEAKSTKDVSIKELTTAEQVRQEIITQVPNRIYWWATIRYLFDKGVKSFYAFGPGALFRGLLQQSEARELYILDKPTPVKSLRNALHN
jgi:malonyl CoA-acyl carrier protein transacylase